MRAEAGRRKPAIKSSREVLPAPDGAENGGDLAGEFDVDFERKIGQRQGNVLQEKLHISGGVRRRNHWPVQTAAKASATEMPSSRQAGGVLAQFHRFVNGKGEGGGLAGHVAGDHDGGAEFAQGARKGQDHPADDAAPGQRNGDGEEDAPLACAERAGDLLEARIDLLKGHAGEAGPARERT